MDEKNKKISKKSRKGKNKIVSKASLAVVLSRLKAFSRPSVGLEQHPTDSEIASQILWTAHMSGELDDTTVADLGCGTGILGIGALLLGAKHVFFIDKDNRALDTLKENLTTLNLDEKPERITILNKDIKELTKEDGTEEEKEKKKTQQPKDTNETENTEQIKADIVIQNPPFGTREKHLDKEFLIAATRIAPIIYSFHKTTTETFVEAFARDNELTITERWHFAFPLKQTQKHHKKKIQRVEVTCFRLER